MPVPQPVDAEENCRLPAEPATPTLTKQSFAAFDSISLRREDQILLLLTLIIEAVVGFVVVGFILVTENLGSKLYLANGAAWRRLLIPIAGSLTAGFFLARYFPNARDSGIPQTKTALFLRAGGNSACAPSRSPAGLRWAVKDPQSTSRPVSRRCWAGGWNYRRGVLG
jgi:hypothetical protein